MASIVFYTDQRGTSPVLELINDLPVFEQAKIRNALRLLKEFGIQLDMPHARHIQGKLWELRPGDIRLFYFAYIEEQFVILHGFRKKDQRTPEREMNIALRRMNEILDEERNAKK